MVWAMRMVKQPDGVSDIAGITFQNRQCFAVSFGKTVCVYSSAGEEVSRLYHTVGIQKIIAYQSGFFLFASDRYFYYKNEKLITKEYMQHSLGTINSIFLQDKKLLVITQSDYLLATVVGRRIEWDSELTDGAFYRIKSAIQTSNGVYMLADCHQRTYVLSYRREDGSYKRKHTRKEVIECGHIFAVGTDLMLQNIEGLWLCNEKPIRVLEFGNYKISHVQSLCGSALVFCSNGEVFEVKRDRNGHFIFRLATRLQCPITCSALVEDRLFCGSLDHSYILDSKEYNVVKYWCGHRALSSIRWCNGLEYVSGSELTRLGRVIPLNKSILRVKEKSYLNFLPKGDGKESGVSDRIEDTAEGNDEKATVIGTNSDGDENNNMDVPCSFDHREIADEKTDSNQEEGTGSSLKCKKYTHTRISQSPLFRTYDPLTIFRSPGFYGISFPNASLVNDCIFPPITDFHSSDELIAFNSSRTVYVVFDKVTTYSIRVISISYYKHCVAVFTGTELVTIDMMTGNIRGTGLAEKDNIEDIVMNEDGIFVIKSDGSTTKITMDDLCGETKGISVATYEVLEDCSEPQPFSIDCRLLNFVKNMKRTEDCQRDIGISTEGIYRYDAGELKREITAQKYIRRAKRFENSIVLECADGVWLFDTQRQRVARLNGDVYCTFVSEGYLYACNRESLYHVVPTFSNFSLWNTHYELKEFEKIVYYDSQKVVVASYSEDLQTVVLVSTDGSKLSFDRESLIGSALLTDNFFVLSLLHLETRVFRLVVLRTTAAGLRVVSSSALTHVPLAICSSGKVLASAHSQGVSLFSLRRGKLKLKNEIAFAASYCSKASFLDNRRLCILCEDMTQRIVDIKKKRVKKRTYNDRMVPFIYRKEICEYYGTKVNAGGIVDCGEEIVHVHVEGDELFVFGRNGSVFLLREETLLREGRHILNELGMPSVIGDLNWVDVDLMESVVHPQPERQEEFEKLIRSFSS